jgi:hypothetical protein
MSTEEPKKPDDETNAEQPPAELSEEALDSVAGGFSKADYERGKRLLEEDAKNNPSLVLFGECR